MAEYRVTYWKHIPSHVEAFDGAERVRSPLSHRFQELIDAAAMQEGLVGTDAYLEGWRLGPVISRKGTPREVAEAVADEIEAEFENTRASALDRPARRADERQA